MRYAWEPEDPADVVPVEDRLLAALASEAPLGPPAAVDVRWLIETGCSF